MVTEQTTYAIWPAARERSGERLIRFHGRRGMVGANRVFAPSGRSPHLGDHKDRPYSIPPSSWCNGITYQADSLIGVIDNLANLGALRSALAQLGISPQQLDLLHGADGLRRLERSDAGTGLPGALRRWVRTLGPETELFQRYEHELVHGSALIVVRHVHRRLADRISALLVTHGGRTVQYYGPFAVTVLVP